MRYVPDHPTVVAFIIIGREITISALREWMATIGARASVAVSGLGKLKTISQLVAIPMLLYDQPLNAPIIVNPAARRDPTLSTSIAMRCTGMPSSTSIVRSRL